MGRIIVAAMLVFVFAAVMHPVQTQGQQNRPNAHLNRLVSVLDEGKPVFGLLVNIAGGGNAPLDGIAHGANTDIDFVMYDMEHGSFDVSSLRTYMQFLLNPAAIGKSGALKANTPIIVRIPAFATEIENNTWMVKQVLDSGAHGVILPHTETPEQAFTLIRAMRYPQKPTGPNPGPTGTRSGAGSLGFPLLGAFDARV